MICEIRTEDVWIWSNHINSSSIACPVCIKAWIQYWNVCSINQYSSTNVFSEILIECGIDYYCLISHNEQCSTISASCLILIKCRVNNPYIVSFYLNRTTHRSSVVFKNAWIDIHANVVYLKTSTYSTSINSSTVIDENTIDYVTIWMQCGGSSHSIAIIIDESGIWNLYSRTEAKCTCMSGFIVRNGGIVDE